MTSEQLKADRKAMHLTQPEAAKELGISERQYKNLELGACPISLTQEKLWAYIKRDRLGRAESH